MKLTIKTPQIITEAGKQTENLDYVLPGTVENLSLSRLFILCDGIGSTRKGNNVARLTGNLFYEYITHINPPKQRLGQVYINDALRYVERKLWNEIKDNNLKQGMGCSMLLMYINADDSISVAWVGNIRAYHVREKQIIFETEDHLTVLRENGRNIAVEPRIISGIEPAWASVSIISDIQTNDYFLLCTQGIYETFDNRNIKYLLSQGDGSDNTNAAIADKMRELCLQNWEDDFTFVLIGIKEGITVPQAISNSIGSNITENSKSQNALRLDHLPSGIIRKKDKKNYQSNKRPLFSGSGGGLGSSAPTKAGIIVLLIVLAIITAFAYKFFVSKPEDVFKNHLTKADTFFENGNYEDAIEHYTNALSIKLPDSSSFPVIREKIKLTKLALLEKQAEQLFNVQNWVKAKAKYVEILKITPEDTLISQQIEVLEQTIDFEKQNLISKADTLFNLKDYESSKQLLYEALYYDQTNEKILEQINLCNQFLNTQTVSMSVAVNMAVKMDSLGEFKANRLSIFTTKPNLTVLESGDIYEHEPNPENIYTTPIPVSIEYSTNKFNELVKKGDDAMQSADFETAKLRYTEALTHKRSAEIEAKLNSIEQAGFTKKYHEIISLADNAYNKGTFETARNFYLEALKYKSNDDYATNRAEECNEKLAASTSSAQVKTEKYNRLIEEANAAFNEQNYSTAKNKFKEALQISTADITNINAKIAECESRIENMQSDSSSKKLKKAEKICKSDNFGLECYNHLKQNKLLYTIDPQILLNLSRFFESSDPEKSRECLNIANNRKE